MGGVQARQTRDSEAVMHAALTGDTARLRALLRDGAEVNGGQPDGVSCGETPLMIAAEMGNLQCMDILIKAGADVNSKAQGGHTALNVAVWRNNVKAVNKLARAGADVNSVNLYRRTALFHAARHGYHQCVKVLIEAGTDVNLVDYSGETPLVATSTGCSQSMRVTDKVTCIRLILHAGAHVNIRNNNNDCDNHYNGHRYAPYCITNRPDPVTMETTLLLLAAGERRTPGTVTPAMLLGEATSASGAPSLKYLCRKAVRGRLANLNPLNLFLQVPRLRLPWILSDYLLYGASLDQSRGSDTII